jgi:ankyrin repeat protein
MLIEEEISTGEVVRLLYNGDTETSEDGNTALMLACMPGNYQMVKSLIENGADINITQRRGNTALLYACNGEDNLSKIIKLLIEKGTNVNVMSSSCGSPLSIVEHRRREDLYWLLQKNGAERMIVE